MYAIGIIAEYNPFHNGHLWQIKQIRERHPKAYVVVALSGHFCQRGIPAMLPPQLRAQTAIDAGADLVLMLPLAWSTASAELFAEGGVKLLHATGIVSEIVCGSECSQSPLFDQVVKILTYEPTEYKILLTEGLKQGLGFAKARENAICHLLSEDVRTLLTGSNSILALAYATAIKRNHLQLNLTLLPRQGNDENNNDYSLSLQSLSALAIRLAFQQTQTDASLNLYELLKSTTTPFGAGLLLKGFLDDHLAISSEKMAPIILNSLNTLPLAYLETIRDMQGGLASRLQKLAFHHDFACENTLQSLVDNTQSRDFTKTRIQRALLALALNIRADFCTKDTPLPYLRLLGTSKQGKYLLKVMRKTKALPIVSQPSEAFSCLGEHSYDFALLDRNGARLWQFLTAKPRHNYFNPPLIK